MKSTVARVALPLLVFVPLCEAEAGHACYDRVFSSSLQPWHDAHGNTCAYYAVDPGARCTGADSTRVQYTSDEACCACHKPDSGAHPYYAGFPMHKCVNDGLHTDFDGAATYATLEECCRSIQPAFYAKCAGKESASTTYAAYPEGRCVAGTPSTPVMYPFCAMSSTGSITYVSARFIREAIPVRDATWCCNNVYKGLPDAAKRCARRRTRSWFILSDGSCIADGQLYDDPVLNSVQRHIYQTDAAGVSACAATAFALATRYMCGGYTCPRPGYIDKASKDTIHCGTAQEDCTPDLCCDVTCANAEVSAACTANFMAKPQHETRLCGENKKTCGANYLTHCCTRRCPATDPANTLCGALFLDTAHTCASLACTTSECCSERIKCDTVTCPVNMKTSDWGTAYCENAAGCVAGECCKIACDQTTHCNAATDVKDNHLCEGAGCATVNECCTARTKCDTVTCPVNMKTSDWGTAYCEDAVGGCVAGECCKIACEQNAHCNAATDVKDNHLCEGAGCATVNECCTARTKCDTVTCPVNMKTSDWGTAYCEDAVGGCVAGECCKIACTQATHCNAETDVKDGHTCEGAGCASVSECCHGRIKCTTETCPVNRRTSKWLTGYCEDSDGCVAGECCKIACTQAAHCNAATDVKDNHLCEGAGCATVNECCTARTKCDTVTCPVNMKTSDWGTAYCEDAVGGCVAGECCKIACEQNAHCNAATDVKDNHLCEGAGCATVNECCTARTKCDTVTCPVNMKTSDWGTAYCEDAVGGCVAGECCKIACTQATHCNAATDVKDNHLCEGAGCATVNECCTARTKCDTVTCPVNMKTSDWGTAYCEDAVGGCVAGECCKIACEQNAHCNAATDVKDNHLCEGAGCATVNECCTARTKCDTVTCPVNMKTSDWGTAYCEDAVGGCVAGECCKIACTQATHCNAATDVKDNHLCEGAGCATVNECCTARTKCDTVTCPVNMKTSDWGTAYCEDAVGGCVAGECCKIACTQATHCNAATDVKDNHLCEGAGCATVNECCTARTKCDTVTCPVNMKTSDWGTAYCEDAVGGCVAGECCKIACTQATHCNAATDVKDNHLCEGAGCATVNECCTARTKCDTVTCPVNMKTSDWGTAYCEDAVGGCVAGECCKIACTQATHCNAETDVKDGHTCEGAGCASVSECCHGRIKCTTETCPVNRRTSKWLTGYCEDSDGCVAGECCKIACEQNAHCNAATDVKDNHLCEGAGCATVNECCTARTKCDTVTCPVNMKTSDWGTAYCEDAVGGCVAGECCKIACEQNAHCNAATDVKDNHLCEGAGCATVNECCTARTKCDTVTCPVNMKTSDWGTAYCEDAVGGCVAGECCKIACEQNAHCNAATDVKDNHLCEGAGCATVNECCTARTKCDTVTCPVNMKTSDWGTAYCEDAVGGCVAGECCKIACTQATHCNAATDVKDNHLCEGAGCATVNECCTARTKCDTVTCPVNMKTSDWGTAYCEDAVGGCVAGECCKIACTQATHCNAETDVKDGHTCEGAGCASVSECCHGRIKCTTETCPVNRRTSKWLTGYCEDSDGCVAGECCKIACEQNAHCNAATDVKDNHLCEGAGCATVNECCTARTKCDTVTCPVNMKTSDWGTAYCEDAVGGCVAGECCKIACTQATHCNAATDVKDNHLCEGAGCATVNECCTARTKCDTVTCPVNMKTSDWGTAYCEDAVGGCVAGECCKIACTQATHCNAATDVKDNHLCEGAGCATVNECCTARTKCDTVTCPVNMKTSDWGTAYCEDAVGGCVAGECCKIACTQATHCNAATDVKDNHLCEGAGCATVNECCTARTKCDTVTCPVNMKTSDWGTAYCEDAVGGCVAGECCKIACTQATHCNAATDVKDNHLCEGAGCATVNECCTARTKCDTVTCPVNMKTSDWGTAYCEDAVGGCVAGECCKIACEQNAHCNAATDVKDNHLCEGAGCATVNECCTARTKCDTVTCPVNMKTSDWGTAYCEDAVGGCVAGECCKIACTQATHCNAATDVKDNHLCEGAGCATVNECCTARTKCDTVTCPVNMKTSDWGTAYCEDAVGGCVAGECCKIACTQATHCNAETDVKDGHTCEGAGCASVSECCHGRIKCTTETCPVNKRTSKWLTGYCEDSDGCVAGECCKIACEQNAHCNAATDVKDNHLCEGAGCATVNECCTARTKCDTVTCPVNMKTSDWGTAYCEDAVGGCVAGECCKIACTQATHCNAATDVKDNHLCEGAGCATVNECCTARTKCDTVTCPVNMKTSDWGTAYCEDAVGGCVAGECCKIACTQATHCNAETDVKDGHTCEGAGCASVSECCHGRIKCTTETCPVNRRTSKWLTGYCEDSDGCVAGECCKIACEQNAHCNAATDVKDNHLCEGAGCATVNECCTARTKCDTVTCPVNMKTSDWGTAYCEDAVGGCVAGECCKIACTQATHCNAETDVKDNHLCEGAGCATVNECCTARTKCDTVTCRRVPSVTRSPAP